MNKHTPGPWMVGMERNASGCTRYMVMEHTHTTVTINPASYYADGQYPETDEDGYYLPDQNIDCDEFRVANARLIAAAPELLEALQGLLRGIANVPDEANAAMLVAKARDAINKATEGEK